MGDGKMNDTTSTVMTQLKKGRDPDMVDLGQATPKCGI